jgi:hypothetical protein
VAAVIIYWLIFLALLGTPAFAQGGIVGKGGIVGTSGIVGFGTSNGVVFDALGPNSSGSKQASGSSSWTSYTNTWTHVAASGAYLFVGCTFSIVSSSVATVAVTYDGTSMTELATVLPDNAAEQGEVYLFDLTTPTSGSHSVVATTTYVSGTKSASDSTTCGSISFTGATGVGTPVTAYGSSTAASSGAVTSATGHMVIDVLGAGTSITSSNQTERWSSTNSGVSIDASAQSTATGASSVTMGYVTSNDVWGIIAVDVQ